MIHRLLTLLSAALSAGAVSAAAPQQLIDIRSEVFYKYRLDSAIRYGERNLKLARRLGDRDCSASAAIRLARFYSSRGACIEARQLLDSVRRALPRSFLELSYRTHGDMACVFPAAGHGWGCFLCDESQRKHNG